MSVGELPHNTDVKENDNVDAYCRYIACIVLFNKRSYCMMSACTLYITEKRVEYNDTLTILPCSSHMQLLPLLW